MSLINKMLQDLESRNTAQVDTANKRPVYEDLKPLSRVPAPRASSRRLPLMLLATVAVVGAAGYAWTQWGQQLLSKPAGPIAAKPVPAVARKATPPRPAPVAVPAAAPAAVASVPAAPAEKPAEAQVKLAQAPVVPAVAMEPKNPEPAPASSRKAKTAMETGYWMVSRGETLYGISVQTGVDLLALSRWNNLGREHVIYPGQRLRLTPPATAETKQAKTEMPGSPEKPKTKLASVAVSGVQQPEPISPPTAATPARESQSGNAVMNKKMKPQSSDEKSESEYRRAADLLEKGRMADAEKHLKSALSINAAHTQARELLAGLMLQQGHWRESQQLLEQGIEKVPAHYPFAQLLARIYVEHGADQKALTVMEESRRAAANNPDYLAFLAALYQRTGKHAEAVKTYNEAVAFNPQEGRSWLGLGISLEAVQDWNAAGAAYQRAINSGVLDDKLLQYARQRLAAVRK